MSLQKKFTYAVQVKLFSGYSFYVRYFQPALVEGLYVNARI